MAKMFPRQLRDNTQSPAERQLFRLFAQHLPQEYQVFHSVAIQVQRSRGGVDDYEIDFVIAHPRYGILFLEVKGGLIRIDGKTDTWSRQQDGNWVNFKNPLEQVKRASYELNKYLKTLSATKRFDYAIWYAVALPDVDVPHDLSPSVPQEIVLDKARLHPAKLTTTIERLFAYYNRNDSKSPPGEQGLKALGSVLAPNWFLRANLGTEFAYEDLAIRELTEEQFNVLDTIAFRKRALIAGCAGSGKTMLAIEMATRFCKTHERVLLTCYNKALAGYLRSLALPENLTVRHFHSLAYQIFEMVGQKDRWKALLENKDEENTNFWVSTLPDELFSMAENLTEAQKFSAIVVDEGQDFHSTYWLPLQLLLQDPNEGSLYIFYDEAQRIYSLDEFPIKDGLTAVFNKNLRSTKPIGQFVADYYPGKDKFIPAGVESQQEVMIVNPTKYADLPTALNDILNMLSEEGVPMQDVVILTMASEGRSQWQHGQKLAGGFDLRWWHYNNKISGKRVVVSTIQAFKGLESAVVILTELDQASREDQADMLIYIGMSRAKNLLIILGDKPPLPNKPDTP